MHRLRKQKGMPRHQPLSVMTTSREMRRLQVKAGMPRQRPLDVMTNQVQENPSLLLGLEALP